MPSYKQTPQTDSSPAIDHIQNSGIFESNVYDHHLHIHSNAQQNELLQAQAFGQQVSELQAMPAEYVAPVQVSTPLDGYLPLAQGANGAGVIVLQTKLNALGASLTVDGDYGGKTASAVQIFQVANGLSRTGSVDATTARSLYSEAVRGLDQAQLEGVPGQFIGEYDAYQGGQHIGTIDVVDINGEKVAVKTARAWETLRNAALADGIQLQLNSGFRTMSEQRHLYAKYGSPRAAVPGYSNHQHGQALDIDAANPEHRKWLFDNAPSFGWRNTVSFEPWHWEYFGD